jgi:hypothetical protein
MTRPWISSFADPARNPSGGHTSAGLPDFSSHNLPKRGKIDKMTINYMKWPQNIPKCGKIDQTDLKCTNIFHCKIKQNLPKLGFLVRKYSIWQPCTSVERRFFYLTQLIKCRDESRRKCSNKQESRMYVDLLAWPCCIIYQSLLHTYVQGCQMVSFQTKNPDLGKFRRALDWKMLIYFMAVWNISQAFGIFYDHWVHFESIWYIFLGLVTWTKKNLATLHVYVYRYSVRQPQPINRLYWLNFEWLKSID